MVSKDLDDTLSSTLKSSLIGALCDNLFSVVATETLRTVRSELGYSITLNDVVSVTIRSVIEKPWVQYDT